MPKGPWSERLGLPKMTLRRRYELHPQANMRTRCSFASTTRCCTDRSQPRRIRSPYMSGCFQPSGMTRRIGAKANLPSWVPRYLLSFAMEDLSVQPIMSKCAANERSPSTHKVAVSSHTIWLGNYGRIIQKNARGITSRILWWARTIAQP